MEGVNLQTMNDISLHTLNGCKHPDVSTNPIDTGNVVSTDCFNQTFFNQGCIVEVPTVNSYGAGFATSGGGVYAMLWNDTGMSMWFFQRGSIPADLPTNSPNPASWPLPTAFYPDSACDFDTFFKPQTFIIVRVFHCSLESFFSLTPWSFFCPEHDTLWKLRWST